MMTVVPFLIKRYSKRTIAVLGMVLTLVGLVGTGVFGDSPTAVIAFNVVKGAALGFILELGKFNADPTGAASLTAIRVSYIWVPGLMSVIMLICLYLLKYDKEYSVAVADLEQGKWKGSDK